MLFCKSTCDVDAVALNSLGAQSCESRHLAGVRGKNKCSLCALGAIFTVKILDTSFERIQPVCIKDNRQIGIHY